MIRAEKHLKWLLALGAYAETGSEENAAKKLGVSERSVREWLNDLREAVGQPLFAPGGKLTSAGRDIRKLSLGATRAANLVAARIEQQTVRLALTSHISRNYLPEILLDKRLADVTLVAIDRRADQVGDAVLSGDADLGVGPIPRKATATDERFELISGAFPAKLVVLCAAKHPHPEAPTWEWMIRQPWVIHETGTATRRVIDNALGAYAKARGQGRPKLRIKAEVTDAMLLVELVRLGLGITIMGDGPVIKQTCETGVARLPAPIEHAPETTVAVFSRRGAIPKRIERIATVVAEKLQDFFDGPP